MTKHTLQKANNLIVEIAFLKTKLEIAFLKTQLENANLGAGSAGLKSQSAHVFEFKSENGNHLNAKLLMVKDHECSDIINKELTDAFARMAVGIEKLVKRKEREFNNL